MLQLVWGFLIKKKEKEKEGKLARAQADSKALSRAAKARPNPVHLHTPHIESAECVNYHFAWKDQWEEGETERRREERCDKCPLPIEKELAIEPPF